jgi:hypothetical protein
MAAWSWSDLCESEPGEISPAPERRELDPLTAQQRQRFREIEAAMVAERRAIWLPMIDRWDRRHQVALAEAGLGPDRVRKRLHRD